MVVWIRHSGDCAFSVKIRKIRDMELVTVVEIWFRLSSKFQLISK